MLTYICIFSRLTSKRTYIGDAIQYERKQNVRYDCALYVFMHEFTNCQKIELVLRF